MWIAQRALGLRLVTGDRAPLLPDEGLRFLSDAWETGKRRCRGARCCDPRAGHASSTGLEHGARVAGEGGVQAAMLPAQRQLVALCPDRALAGRLSASSSQLKLTQWLQLARSVNLRHWRTSPAANILSDDPRVSTFPGFATPEVCAVLVQPGAGAPGARKRL